jgi:hypothetical protein
MKRLKISPSLLEQYRIVRAGMYNTTVQTLFDYIKKEYKPNEATSRGTAYHRLIEEGGHKFQVPSGYEVYEKELNRTWKFTDAAALPALQAHETYKDMVREAWGSYETKVNGVDIFMRCRYDGLEGLDIHEFKTSKNAQKYSDFYGSMQWRCYLLSLPDAQRIHYTCFQLGTNNDWCKPNSFAFERDETVEPIVMDTLRSFVGWITNFPELVACIEEKDIIKPT